MNKVLLAALLWIALTITACATMIRGTTEELQFTSAPLGAKANLSNGQSCTTPCSLNLARNASFSVTFSKENCDDHIISVFPVLAGAGVILGGLIDYGTGAVYSLQPNPVVAGLKCRQPSGPSGPLPEKTGSAPGGSAPSTPQ